LAVEKALPSSPSPKLPTITDRGSAASPDNEPAFDAYRLLFDSMDVIHALADLAHLRSAKLLIIRKDVNIIIFFYFINCSAYLFPT